MKVLSAGDSQICILPLINQKCKSINFGKDCAMSCKILIVLMLWLYSVIKALFNISGMRTECCLR